MKIACIGLEPGNVSAELVRRGINLIGVDVEDKPRMVYEIEKHAPDVLIYTAALTDVDMCEAYPQLALKINTFGVDNIISWYKGKFIYLSTVHVFDGKKDFHYGYSEGHQPCPVNAYGQSKWAGERIARSGYSDSRIIRTSKLFTREQVENIAKNAHNDLEVTRLIKRSFMYVGHFVDALLGAIHQFDDLPEITNIAGSQILSYATFYKRIYAMAGSNPDLITVRTRPLKNATPRPFNGGLNCGISRHWNIKQFSVFDGLKAIL